MDPSADEPLSFRHAGSLLLKSHLKLRNTPPDVLTVAESESLVVECEAGGNPPPTIHWLKNGRRIDQVRRIPLYHRSATASLTDYLQRYAVPHQVNIRLEGRREHSRHEHLFIDWDRSIHSHQPAPVQISVARCKKVWGSVLPVVY